MENDLTLPARFSKVLTMDGAMNLYVEWLMDSKGAMWPEAFITWAYKRNYRLMEVKHD